MRTAICIATIREGKILLVKKKNTWILPGGKPENDESDKGCLIRELNQELPKLHIIDQLQHFGNFTGKTPHKGDQLTAKVYLSPVEGDITPAAEISDAQWTAKPENYNLSDITRKIIAALKNTGHLS